MRDDLVPETPGAPVWGRDDLTCPVPWSAIRRIIRHARAHPWRGDGTAWVAAREALAVGAKPEGTRTEQSKGDRDA